MMIFELRYFLVACLCNFSGLALQEYLFYEGIYLTKCVALGRNNTFHKEEGWYDADVHWLLLALKNDYQETIPTP